MDVENEGKRSIEIESVRFIANYLVLGIHCLLLLGGASKMMSNKFWFSFSQYYCPIAMPTLFFLSGYLTFKKSKTYFQLIRSRFGRLVVPYLLWNLIIGLLFVVARLGGFLKASSVDVINIHSTIYWLIPKVLSFTDAPAVMPLWYIRTIFIYILLSPILTFVIKGNRILVRFVFLVILCTLFAVFVETTGQSNAFMYTYPPYSLICFLFGGFIALNKIELSLVWSQYRWLFLGIGAVTFLVFRIVPCCFVVSSWLRLGHVFILLGCADCLCKLYVKLPSIIKDSSFWVYVMHLPVFLILALFITRVPCESVTLRLVPGIILAMIIILSSYKITRFCFPKLSVLLNGECRI